MKTQITEPEQTILDVVGHHRLTIAQVQSAIAHLEQRPLTSRTIDARAELLQAVRALDQEIGACQAVLKTMRGEG